MEDLKIFRECFKFEPNLMQKEFSKSFHDFNILVLKSLTGSGKTEATLAPSLVEKRKTIYLLPTRSLIDDQQNRFRIYLSRLSKIDHFPHTLAVDMGNYTKWFVFREGKEYYAKWYHLYNADVILSTYEKFESRLLGYGAVKSYAYPYKLFIANEPFSIIIDEFHLISESVARFVTLKSLVKLALNHNNLKLVFMSATSPRWLVNFLMEEAKSSYKIVDFIDDEQKLSSLLNEHYGKWRQLHFYHEEEKIYEKLNPDYFRSFLSEISDKQVIIKAHSVKIINELFEKLAKYCERSMLYHGNLADEIRSKIYEMIKRFNEQGIPFVLFTTHAIEVGCDIDADIMILEFCEPSSLIQSLGRLNRKLNRPEAKLYIFGNEFPEVQKEKKFKPASLEEISEQTQKVLKCSVGTIDKFRLISQIRNIMNSELYQESVTRRLKKNIFIYFEDMLRMITLSSLLDKKGARSMWEDWRGGIMLGSDAWPLVEVGVKLNGKLYTITVSMEELLGHDDCKKVKFKLLVPDKDSREEVGPRYGYNVEKGIPGIYVEIKDDFAPHFVRARIIDNIKVIDFVNVPKVLDYHILIHDGNQEICEVTYCGKEILRFKRILEY